MPYKVAMGYVCVCASYLPRNFDKPSASDHLCSSRLTLLVPFGRQLPAVFSGLSLAYT